MKSLTICNLTPSAEPICDAQDSTLPLRVLHVFGRMNRGGAEMRTLELMRVIDRARYRLDYCSLSGLPGVLDDEIQELGGRVYYCRLGPTFPFQFIRLLRRESIDVVHSHVHYVSGVMLLLARLAGVKGRIAHFRTTGEEYPTSRLRLLRDRTLRTLVDLFATDILAVSAGSMSSAWTRFRGNDDRCKVIYNGIDLGMFNVAGDREAVRQQLNIDSTAPVFIHVGNFTYAKNHERLVAIFGEILRLQPTAVLVLVGGGEQGRTELIQERVRNIGIEHAVRFCGVRTDIPKLLSAGDAMIFPSRWEGLPGAVVEARAAGLPVIGSDLSGIREISSLVGGVMIMSLEASDEQWAGAAVNALLDPPEDSPEKLGESPFDLGANVRQYSALWSVH